MPERAIFRERAVQHYVQRHEKHVLPSFVSPPIFLFLWIIMGLGVIMLLLAWNTRIPVYTSGTGMIVEHNQPGHIIALLLVPSEQLHSIHPGQPVQLFVGSNGQPTKYSITTVAPMLLSPDEIRRQYHLDGTLSLLVTQPAVVVEVELDTAIFTSHYLGSTVKAEVQIGSRRVLSVLPLVGPMIGE